VQAPASDEELAARQSALRAEAAALLDQLDRLGVFADIGPLVPRMDDGVRTPEEFRDWLTDREWPAPEV
jgi:hypothetical protein